jgi:4-amino-4-deoxy-L-arabinose transferase-like glycosyltransferase
MADIRRFGTADLLLLLLVLAVAAGARAGYLINCADSGRNSGPLTVQDPQPPLSDVTPPAEMRGSPRPTDLDALIDNLEHHQWFGSMAPYAPQEEQTAHVAPGYPWLLALLARGVGDSALDSTVRWIQCGLGALTAVLYFLFARRAFRSLAAGTLAGLFAALWPFWVINTAAIDDGVLTTFLLALALFLGARAGETGGALSSLLFGLALAGVSLVRAALLPFAFVAVVWFLLRTRTLPRGWLAALLAFLGFANGLAPWTVRNLQVYGEPIPVADSAYLHLWVGNNPKATGGPLPAEALSPERAAELRKIVRQPERYAHMGTWVREEVRDHPVETLRRRANAALMFFFGARWFQDGSLAERTPVAEEGMPRWLEDAYPMALQASLLALLFLALLGWRWSYLWRYEALPATLAVLWVPLPYVLGHAEALSGPRLPLDGVLLCYAAFALACLLPGGGGEPGQKAE